MSRRVVFCTSDDERAISEIGELAEDHGLSESGLFVQAHGNTWVNSSFKTWQVQVINL